MFVGHRPHPGGPAPVLAKAALQAQQHLVPLRVWCRASGSPLLGHRGFHSAYSIGEHLSTQRGPRVP